MLKSTFRIALESYQYKQIRFGHRMRGKAPIYARSIKERLEELNAKDELSSVSTNIGFPREKVDVSQIRRERLDHIKKLKANKELEQLARNHQIEVNLADLREDWLSHNGPNQKKTIAEHYSIFEHLYGEGYYIPYLNLDIQYELTNETVLPVCTGNVIKPTEAKTAPLINYKSDSNSLWTLTLVNLDGHLTENDKEYLHWFIANIPGSAIEKGDHIVDYLGPFPLQGTGFHRYVFVLYKQNGRVDFSDITKVTTQSLEGRTFVTRDWYQKYQDVITPAGLAFFQTDWDISVKDFFHNTLNMREPVYEYDFAPPYIRPQEWFPRRKPFNLYMDKYRDPKQINKEYLLRKLKDHDPFMKPPKPLRFPNAQRLPQSMPSWLKLHETKIRLKWGRVNDV